MSAPPGPQPYSCAFVVLRANQLWGCVICTLPHEKEASAWVAAPKDQLSCQPCLCFALFHSLHMGSLPTTIMAPATTLLTLCFLLELFVCGPHLCCPLIKPQLLQRSHNVICESAAHNNRSSAPVRYVHPKQHLHTRRAQKTSFIRFIAEGHLVMWATRLLACLPWGMLQSQPPSPPPAASMRFLSACCARLPALNPAPCVPPHEPLTWRDC
jgi:hypothetical protein